MNLGLSVNYVELDLMAEFNERYLMSAGITKLGRLGRLAISSMLQTGDTVFWAKNPDAGFFEGEVLITPCVDFSENVDLQFGTSCYLAYNCNRVRHFVFQAIGSYSAARYLLNAFRAAAADRFGKAEELNYTSVPVTLNGISGFLEHHLQWKWKKSGEVVVSELSEDGTRSTVHWVRVD